MNWVLNTIAYGDLMAQESFGQLDMIDSVKGLGFDYIELRSEYFDGSDQELVDIKAANQEEGLTVFHSVLARFLNCILIIKNCMLISTIKAIIIKLLRISPSGWCYTIEDQLMCLQPRNSGYRYDFGQQLN